MGKLICIVEEDRTLIEPLENALRSKGFDISICSELLIDNLSIFTELILVDAANGKDICEELKKNEATKDIPVLMMSSDHSLRQICIDSGAADFIAKPYDAELVAEQIKGLLA